MRIRCPTTSAVSTASTSSRSVARKAREREHRKRLKEQQARMRAGVDVFQQEFEQDDEYPATRRVRTENASTHAYTGKRTTPTKQEIREARMRQMKEAAARRAEESSSPLKRGLQYIYNNFIPTFGFSGTPNGATDDSTPPETPTRRSRKTYATPGAFPGLSLDSDSEESPSPTAGPDVEMADDTFVPPSSGTATGARSDSSSFSSSSPSTSSGNRSSFYAFPSSSATSTEDLFSGQTHSCDATGCTGGCFYIDSINSFRIFHDCHAKKEDDCMADAALREKELREEKEAERVRKHAEKERREREKERTRRKEEERLRRETEDREYVRRQQERRQKPARNVDPFGPVEENSWEEAAGNRRHTESPRVYGRQPQWWKTYKEEIQRARERDEKLRKEREEKEKQRQEEFERKKKEREEQAKKAKEESGNRQYYEHKWKARYAQARAHPYARGKAGRARGGLRFSPPDPFEFPAAGTPAFTKKYTKPTFPGSSPAASGPKSKGATSPDSVHDRKKYSKEPPVYFEWYDSAWMEINAQRVTSSLSFSEIPWAVVPFPRSHEEITTAKVKSFVRTKHSGNPGLRRVAVKERRAAAKKELLNWHSDKFATRVLERVADPAEREAISRAADVVQKALTEYMREAGSE